MNFCFNPFKLSDTTKGVSYDDFSMKQNASSSSAGDDSETFHVSANVVSKTFPIRSEDYNVAEEPQIQKAKRSEELDPNSNSVLRYIIQLLLEEDTDEKPRTYEEELALLATERAFNDVLRQEYYSPPDEPLLPDAVYQMNSVGGSNYKKSYDGGGRKSIQLNGPVDDTHSITPPLESADPASALPIESLTAKQIQKGIDEAMKFVQTLVCSLLIWGPTEQLVAEIGCPEPKGILTIVIWIN